MQIGLIDVEMFDNRRDKKKQHFPNLALMKLSAWHKQHGDSVEFYSSNHRYDKVYVSKVFTYSKLPFDLQPNFETGGSGYDLAKILPADVEHIYPDYRLYDIDYAMGYITRGCNRSCPFCIVHKKEGSNHFNAKIEEFWNGQKKLKILDNSVCENKEALPELKKIRDFGIRLDITQGFNARNITKEFADVLADIKLWEGMQMHTAWDNYYDERQFFNGIKILNESGIDNSKIIVLCLIGLDPDIEHDKYRLNKLKSLGIRPYAMQYKKIDNSIKNVLPIEYRIIAHWCNEKRLFWKWDLEEFIRDQIGKPINHINRKLEGY